MYKFIFLFVFWTNFLYNLPSERRIMNQMFVQREQTINNFVIKHEPSTFDTSTNVSKINELHNNKKEWAFTPIPIKFIDLQKSVKSREYQLFALNGAVLRMLYHTLKTKFFFKFKKIIESRCTGFYILFSCDIRFHIERICRLYGF